MGSRNTLEQGSNVGDNYINNGNRELYLRVQVVFIRYRRTCGLAKYGPAHLLT